MLKTKIQNSLLYSGAGIFSCTSLVYFIISSKYPNLIPTSNKLGNFDNIFLIILSTLIIAPFFEEIIFRGIFTKRKIYLYCFYIGSLIMILLTKNYYLILLVILFFMIQLKKNEYLKISYYVGSFLFALIHYSFRDFENTYSFIPVFFQFSIGLILIWITINFGIKWSIFCHFLINSLIILPIILLLQFPNMKVKFIEDEKNKISWQKTTLFGSSNIIYTSKNVDAKRVTIEQFVKLFNDNELKKVKINDSVRLYRYNFNLETKNGNEVKARDVKKLLIKSKLIELDN